MPERRKATGASARDSLSASASDSASHKAAYSVGHALADFLTRGVADNSDATKSCYEQRAGHLSRLMATLPLAGLHLDQIQGYVDQRLAEGAARETIRKELCVLRRALTLACRRGADCPEPAAIFPRFRTRYVPRKQWLTEKDFERLLDRLPSHRKLWLLAAVYLGCRLSELQKLRWEDAAPDLSAIHVRGRKTGGADRVLPIPARLARELQSHRAARGPLLLKWQNVRRDLAKYCAELGLPKSTPNDLRRTYASWLVQAGESSFVVSQLLGHSSSTMVERVYGRQSPATLRSAVDKLPK